MSLPDMESIYISAETLAYPPQPEETLAYEQYMIGGAIRNLQALLDKQPSHAKSREYYEVMMQVMIVMDETISRMELLNK